MNREEDPQLWDLLGRAQPVEPSAFFVHNVVRAARHSAAPPFSWRAWWTSRRVLVPTFAAAAALLLAVTGIEKVWVRNHRVNAVASEENSLSDPDDPTTADLNLLVDSDDDSDDTSLL